MTETVVGALLPGAALKLNPTVHPYTLDGLELLRDSPTDSRSHSLIALMSKSDLQVTH